MKIPKIIHQIWVGDKPAPKKWLKTWQDIHYDWKYILWDNENIKRLKLRNQEQFDFYWKQKRWHGVADILRYEILFQFGGIMPGADSECKRRVDKLFNDEKYDCYAVVNDCGKFQDEPDLTFKDANISPLYGCVKEAGLRIN